MTLDRAPVHSPDAPQPIGPYVQAVRAGGFLFLSGQVGIDPATGAMVAGDVVAQARQVLRNLAAVLAAGGSGLDRVVKVTVFLADMADFPRVNEVYAEAFGAAPPARATVAVRSLPASALVEMDAVALCGTDGSRG